MYNFLPYVTFLFRDSSKSFLLSWKYKVIINSASWKHNTFRNYWCVRLKVCYRYYSEAVILTCMKPSRQSQLLGPFQLSSFCQKGPRSCDWPSRNFLVLQKVANLQRKKIAVLLRITVLEMFKISRKIKNVKRLSVKQWNNLQ